MPSWALWRYPHLSFSFQSNWIYFRSTNSCNFASQLPSIGKLWELKTFSSIDNLHAVFPGRPSSPTPSSIISPPPSGLVWYQRICRDGRVLSRPISQTPLIPESPFGRGVLGQKIPAYPRLTPSPIHFLPWAESRTWTSRIIPVPDSKSSSPNPIERCSKRPAASDRRRAEPLRERQSILPARGAEHLSGGRGWIPPSRSHIRSPPFLQSDRRRHYCRFDLR
jgi:hypothetical protein